MKNNEALLKKLDERREKGEISEDIYSELKAALEAPYSDIPVPPQAPTPPEPPRRTEKISISGAGKLSGPIVTERFTVSGAGEVDGDVDAHEVKISGAAEIKGSIKADEVKCSGAVDVKGDVTAQEFHCSGAGEVKGKVVVDEFHCSGGFEAGSIEASEVHASGAIKTGSIKADEVELSGGVEIPGAITASEVRINVGGNGKIGSIKADEIEIQRAGGFILFGGLFHSRGGMLSVKTIEGTEVTVDYVKADLVIGEEVTVGPDCDIRELRARSVRIHEDAKVGKRVALKRGAEGEEGKDGSD